MVKKLPLVVKIDSLRFGDIKRLIRFQLEYFCITIIKFIHIYYL